MYRTSLALLGMLLLVNGGWRASAADANLLSSEESPLTLTQTIPLPELKGGTNHLAADAKRGRFFVTAPGERKVVVIDLKAGKVLRVLADVPASAACFIPDQDQLCLSGGGGVTFYDGGTLAATGKVDLHSTVDELRYDAKEKRLYAGLMDADKPGIGVIDVPNRKLLASLKLPAKPQGFVLEQNGTRIYANTPGAQQVTVVDRQEHTIVGEWKLTEAQSNYPIALDERNRRLFVGCRRPPRLVVLDSTTGAPVASVETGGDADDMSFDTTLGRIYLAGGTGVITAVQQVDADHYRKLRDTPTQRGARNALFVPELKAFYLAIPHDGDMPAELRAYQARD